MRLTSILFAAPCYMPASPGWGCRGGTGDLGESHLLACELVMSTLTGADYLVEGVTISPSPPSPPANSSGENLDQFGRTMVASAALLPS